MDAQLEIGTALILHAIRSRPFYGAASGLVNASLNIQSITTFLPQSDNPYSHGRAIHAPAQDAAFGDMAAWRS